VKEGRTGFKDRTEAGLALADALASLVSRLSIVAAIPRGGVVVAAPIARRLGAPLTCSYARKLTAPIAPEVAFGALDEDGEAVTDREVVAALGLRPDDVERIKARVGAEIRRQMAAYPVRPLARYLPGVPVLLVDDGLATGLTVEAALRYARRHGATEVTVSAPCASAHAADRFRREADRFVSLIVDEAFMIEPSETESKETMDAFADAYLAADRVIITWAMGVTQQKKAVATIKEIVNLLLLRGNIGKPGAGASPIRGHSNVQGDRTMGIFEKMPESFMDALEAEFGFPVPREHGHDALKAVTGLAKGDVKVFIAMGGNFVGAISDTAVAEAAIGRTWLQIRRKLVALEAPQVELMPVWEVLSAPRPIWQRTLSSPPCEDYVLFAPSSDTRYRPVSYSSLWNVSGFSGVSTFVQ